MKKWQKIFIGAIVASCIVVSYKYYIDSQHEIQKAKMLSEQQATDIDSLKQKLKLKQEQAKHLSTEIEKAQDDKIQPVTRITVTAPNVSTAVDTITDKINRNDKTLPPEVLEKTDRTVVTPQPKNKDYPVGVYKINLDKSHKIKAGATMIDNKPYWSIGYQQHKTEIVIHGQDKIEGGSIMYTIKEW